MTDWNLLQTRIKDYAEGHLFFPDDERARLRDELFDQLYFALEKEARAVVWKGGSKQVTNTAQAITNKVWKKKLGFTGLIVQANKSGGSAQSFFRRVLRNQFIDWLRAKGTRQHVDGDWQPAFGEDHEPDDLFGVEPSAGWHEAVDTADRKRDVIKALENLPERMRETLLLRRAHGLTIAECALELKVAVSTVKRDEKEALSLIRKELGVRLGTETC